MALELQDINPVNLDIYIDAADELRARHVEDELAAYDDTVLARSDDRIIAFNLAGPEGWVLTASHEDEDGELVEWQQGEGLLSHAFPDPSTDPLPITVTATSAGNGATKVRKIHIDAKPSGALPDRP